MGGAKGPLFRPAPLAYIDDEVLFRAGQAQAQRDKASIVSELLEFLTRRWKLWLVPMILVLVLFALLLSLGGGSIGDFVYPEF